MRVRKTRTYLQKLILLEVIIFLIISLWYFNRINQIQEESSKEKLLDIANGIEQYFLTTIAVTESILLQEAKKIQSLELVTSNKIYNIISEFETTNMVKDLVGWSALSWLDFPSNKITVDSSLGVLKDPIGIDLEKRRHIRKAFSQYNTLFIGEPIIGSISGESRLPFGLGITDTKGRYLGTLIGGYALDKLRHNIITTYKYDQIINYSIFNKDGVVLVESENNSILKEEILSTILPSKESRSLTPYIFSKDQKIVKKVSNLPFYIMVKINPESPSESYLKTIKKSAFDILVILLSSVLLTTFIRKTLLKPLIQLSKNAQQIASNSSKIDFKTYNTYELVMMSDALKQVVEQKFALSDANQKLEFLAHKAQVASNAKSDFIRNLQHELRTPLNHILGATEVLSVLSPEEQSKEYLEMITKSGKDLLDNINKVIDLADYDAGKIKLTETKTSVDDLIEAALSQVYSKLNLKKIKVVESYDTNLPQILVDADKFIRILACILDNSITFSKQKEAIITVKAYYKNFRLYISISDNGLGIKEDDLERITESFESSGNILTKFHRGIGLGLTIVKSVLELHDADLSISSQEGLGTEIIIVLPKYRIVK
jgi:signal transduction histidine kinase